MILKLYHSAVFIYYIFALWYDQMYVDIPTKYPELEIKFFKGRLKFLTIWNMLVQTAFFAVCILNDLVGTDEPNPRSTPLIRKIKDNLLACIAFPIAMFVGLTFWALMAVDRELVFPKALDPFFPWWLNHIMHTNIMVFIILEMFVTFRRYPDRRTGLTTLFVFLISYLVWMHVIYFYTGIWVYPVLDVLNLPLRVVFFLVLFALSVALYRLGEFVNNKIWASELAGVRPVSGKQSKKKHT